MKINSYGQVSLTEKEIFEAIYTKTLDSLSDVYVDDKFISELFNKSNKDNYNEFDDLNFFVESSISQEEFDKLNQKNWFIPPDYKDFDIIEHLYNICPKENINRLSKELKLYEQYNLIDLLKFLKYLVDMMKTHKIPWGIGRGSSVSSYVLFLLEIHKIDSVKHRLDISEFLN
jgi:DNA polymerase III alpha subunit